MTRTVLLTGSASGIGAATRELLEQQGCRVIGVNRRGGEIMADLSRPDDRARVVEECAALTGGVLDAVIGCAGVTSPGELVVRCNYFGQLAVLQGVRPLLEAAPHPRAVAVGSVGMVTEIDDDLVAACLDGDEDRAVRRAEEVGAATSYCSARRALGRWVRRHAASKEWAGAGIPCNVVAPGIIDTPLMHDAINTAQGQAYFAEHYPMPLGGFGAPEQVAPTLAFMASAENSMITGQVIFVDAGTEVSLRPDEIWA